MENNLRILRIRAGFTQKELAEKTGIVQSRIAKYENLDDVSNLTVGVLQKIATACGAKLDDVISPLPPVSEGDEILDFVSETYVKDKEDAENGDIEAVIRNRFA